MCFAANVFGSEERCRLFYSVFISPTHMNERNKNSHDFDSYENEKKMILE